MRKSLVVAMAEPDRSDSFGSARMHEQGFLQAVHEKIALVPVIHVCKNGFRFRSLPPCGQSHKGGNGLLRQHQVASELGFLAGKTRRFDDVALCLPQFDWPGVDGDGQRNERQNQWREGSRMIFFRSLTIAPSGGEGSGHRGARRDERVLKTVRLSLLPPAARIIPTDTPGSGTDIPPPG